MSVTGGGFRASTHLLNCHVEFRVVRSKVTGDGQGMRCLAELWFTKAD